jgi:hypothetical protein
MAVRKPADGTPAAPAPGAEAMITTLARVLNRMIVNASYGPAPMSFRQICTIQLHVASDAEVDVIEAWMKAHP